MAFRLRVLGLALLVTLLATVGACAATYQRMVIPPLTIEVQAGDSEVIASLCLDSNRAAPGPDDTYSVAYADPGDVEVRFGDERMTLNQALAASPPLVSISGSEERSPNGIQIANHDPHGRPMTLSVNGHFVLAAADDSVGDVLPFVQARRAIWSHWAPLDADDRARLEARNQIIWAERYDEAAAEVRNWLPELADDLSIDDSLALSNLKAIDRDLSSRPQDQSISFILIRKVGNIVGVAVSDGKPHVLHRGEIASELFALQTSPKRPQPLFLVGNSSKSKALSSASLLDPLASDPGRYAAKVLQIDIVTQAIALSVPVPAMPPEGRFAANLLGDYATPELLYVIRVEQSSPPEAASLIGDPVVWSPLPVTAPQMNGPPGGVPPIGGTAPPPEGPRPWRFWIATKGAAKSAWSRAKDWLVVSKGGSAVAASVYLTDRLERSDPQPNNLKEALATYHDAFDGMDAFLDSRDGGDRDLTTSVTFWRRQLIGMQRADLDHPREGHFASVADGAAP